jgi:plasmid stability protein
MDQYPLRNIPDDLWREARIRTTSDGISMRDIFVRALEIYSERGATALWSSEKALRAWQLAAKKGAVPKRKTA